MNYDLQNGHSPEKSKSILRRSESFLFPRKHSHYCARKHVSGVTRHSSHVTYPHPLSPYSSPRWGEMKVRGVFHQVWKNLENNVAYDTD
jgi:hypothetical protein